jgi:hypothetical protein
MILLILLILLICCSDIMKMAVVHQAAPTCPAELSSLHAISTSKGT